MFLLAEGEHAIDISRKLNGIYIYINCKIERKGERGGDICEWLVCIFLIVQYLHENSFNRFCFYYQRTMFYATSVSNSRSSRWFRMASSSKVIFSKSFARFVFSTSENIWQETLSHSRRETNRRISKKFVSVKKKNTWLTSNEKSYKIKFAKSKKNGLLIWIVDWKYVCLHYIFLITLFASLRVL